jgi:hypothetical protein
MFLMKEKHEIKITSKVFKHVYPHSLILIDSKFKQS